MRPTSMDRLPMVLLEALQGGTSTLLTHSRAANLRLARLIVSTSKEPCTILDLDAFYSSNADVLFRGLSDEKLKSIELWLPHPGVNPEDTIADLTAEVRGTFIIDSLNTLNHLFSTASRRSGGRKLAFTISALDHLARERGISVLLIMYDRGSRDRTGRSQPISSYSRVTMGTTLREDTIAFSCLKGGLWNEDLSIRIP